MPHHHPDPHIALTAAQRQQRALQLRLEGKTFDEIARQVGYANRSGARKAINRALDLVTLPAAERFRREQMERTYAVINGLTPKVREGDDKAAQALLRAMAALDKYTGLDFKLEELARRDGVEQVAEVLEGLLGKR
ncbi:hypothetical protein [Actinomyces provencensis]|uniref:hypothetical protein n=1 Tax=Actinomyces provencensis TaxID=1720198 RepID=UPI00096A8485|nr:hypothetical protein [Actinomyces provencensis]